MKPGRRASFVQRAIRAGWPASAAGYHVSTRDVRILSGDESEAYEAYLEHRARTEAPPEPFKETIGPGLVLPRGTHASEFPNVLLSRRTWRGFGEAPVPARKLGSLLDLTFACQLEGVRQGVRVVFRTSPSGGTCHPIEAYVLTPSVRGVPPGLYHYSPRTSRLHLMRKGASPALVEKYLAGQTWFAGAGALVLMTAVMPRVWWRYPHARSYRAVLLEAGHFCQTFCLAATWLGLAPFCTMALNDARIERDLGLDGVNEILLYAAGAGTRPAGGRWVQWPGHRPDIVLPGDQRTGPKRRSRAAR